ncbi:hypothetical protein [Ferruginibacter sp. SUN106]|uniref:hypothetical protein n=1 Tax=Ferruginibacter sp. SUN106 TaxID=2978348 RepID=UPI003D3611E8
MKTIVLILFITAISPSFAQPTMQQRIQDSVIGWKSLADFKNKQYKPLVVDGQTFSPYQQSLRDSFITWMQRSYVPIGGFGDIYQRDFTSRQNKFPVPQSIGMTAGIYGFYKNQRTGKYEMTPNEDHNDVFIYTNTLAGINNAALLSSPDCFYFTMQKDNYASTFTNQKLIDEVKEFGLHDDSRFSKYLVYFLSQSWVTVVLTPGNKLPIVQLTKGEVLALCEKGLQRELEGKKDEARHMSSNNPSYYAGVIKDLDEKQYPQCIKNLNTLKGKYKDRLNEPAVLYGWAGPSFADFVNSNTTLFVEDWYQDIPGYPVYRYTKEAIDNSKKDKPLWVEITWPLEKKGTRVKSFEVYKAMLCYFNYDYVYDYFFNPEKVKGIAYAPSNAAEQKEQIQRLKKHYTVTETNPLPQGVFFMDDFSANANGDRPAGWNDSKTNPATIVALNGKPGKWVQLGKHNNLSPSTALKKSLPENFTMEFDVATDEFNFRTGGAVTINLSSYPTTGEGWVVPDSKGTELSLRIEAGNEADYNNNNYRGNAEIKINSTVSSYEGAFYYTHDLREFTNKKTALHVLIKVNNGGALLFINDKQVAVSTDFKKDYCNNCVCKGIPPGTAFRKITFTNNTQNWSPDSKSNAVNVYISNIKISKN